MTALALALILALGQLGSVLVSGHATWYHYHEGQAAAGPELRELLGPDWRGQVVTVCANGRCVTTRLTDSCWCPVAGRVIDLDRRDFAKLADPSRGVIAVTVEYGGPRVTPPATDTGWWTWPGGGPR